MYVGEKKKEGKGKEGRNVGVKRSQTERKEKKRRKQKQDDRQKGRKKGEKKIIERKKLIKYKINVSNTVSI